MKAEIILTTEENGALVEKVVGHTNVTMHTDFRSLLTDLREKHFDSGFNVRRDSALFGFTAVDSSGDTLHVL
jgi:hypothetical protein